VWACGKPIASPHCHVMRHVCRTFFALNHDFLPRYLAEESNIIGNIGTCSSPASDGSSHATGETCRLHHYIPARECRCRLKMYLRRDTDSAPLKVFSFRTCCTGSRRHMYRLGLWTLLVLPCQPTVVVVSVTLTVVGTAHFETHNKAG